MGRIDVQDEAHQSTSTYKEVKKTLDILPTRGKRELVSVACLLPSSAQVRNGDEGAVQKVGKGETNGRQDVLSSSLN